MLDDLTRHSLEDLEILADPIRRRLYRHVLEWPEPVSRDEAAAAAGIGRPLAAHHLDRLAAAGLLSTEYRRRSGRSGPGAGRPAKLYRPSGRELRASLPERRYEVAADLFATALDAGGGPDLDPRPGDALEQGARSRGLELGAEARRRAASRSRASRREALVEVLREAGYAPFERDGELRMLNCPFHELAQRHRTLTCGMNLALLRGLMSGAGLPEEDARLDLQPGMCCVAITPAADARRPNRDG